MEEVVDGTRRAIVVECKHTGTVGRPVVQKLHSAIATFEFDGPKRGMVVTTGRFTNPAQEYAQCLQ
jgi:restriction endonuclease Mrr